MTILQRVLLVCAVLLYPSLALATTVTVPYSFSAGNIIYSSQMNANFQAVVTGFANIDNTNIGANGIFASQIIPLNTTEATFGGTVAYTFPAGLLAGGTAEASKGGSSVQTYVPPMYAANGTASANTLHGVYATCTFAAANTCGVTMTSPASFTSSSSYTCFSGSITSGGTPVTGILNQSATTFVLSTGSTTSQTISVVCIGV